MTGSCTRSTTPLRFFVFPAGGETGAVLLDGSWSLKENALSAPIGEP